MGDTVLFAAAEALVSHELGIDSLRRPNQNPCFLFGGSYVEINPAEYADGQEPPYFGIEGSASDVSVFSVKNELDWDFYVVRTSVLASCFDGQSCVSLSLVEPVSLHVKVGGIKQAVNLACSI